jgi:hypothetical protein
LDPVQAAPGFTVTPGGIVGGNRQWLVSVTPDAALCTHQGPPNGTSGSLATEIGFKIAPGNLLSITKNATNFPNDNSGNAIGAGYPTGPGATMLGNKVVAFLGSDFFTTATPKELVTIVTAGSGPTTLSWLGACSFKGRIS